MKTVVIFLVEDKRGRYLQVNPDFEKGKFTSTNFPIDGLLFRSFGLPKSFEANGFGYMHQSNLGKTKEEVRLKTFKTLINDLSNGAETRNFDVAYILIKIKEDQDCGTFWLLTADYQFLLKEKE